MNAVGRHRRRLAWWCKRQESRSSGSVFKTILENVGSSSNATMLDVLINHDKKQLAFAATTRIKQNHSNVIHIKVVKRFHSERILLWKCVSILRTGVTNFQPKSRQIYKYAKSNRDYFIQTVNQHPRHFATYLFSHYEIIFNRIQMI